MCFGMNVTPGSGDTDLEPNSSALQAPAPQASSGRGRVAMDDAVGRQIEDILTQWAQGATSARDTQKILKNFGYKANLRERLGNDVELTPTGTGPVIRVLI